MHRLCKPLLKTAYQPIAMQPKDALYHFQRTKNFWIPGHTCVIKREVLIKYGGFNQKLKERCDWFIFHQIALLEGMVYIPGPLAFLYIHPRSYSAQRNRSRAGRKMEAKAMLEILDQKSLRTTRQLFYQALLLSWICKTIPMEFLKPKRWSVLYYFFMKQVRKIAGFLDN